jgi:hypothetical protein
LTPYRAIPAGPAVATRPTCPSVPMSVRALLHRLT